MIEFDKGWVGQIFIYIVKEQKHQIDKKVLRQYHKFSTRLPFSEKTIREINFSLAKAKYETTQDINDNLQQLKSKTEPKFYRNISNY